MVLENPLLQSAWVTSSENGLNHRPNQNKNQNNSEGTDGNGEKDGLDWGLRFLEKSIRSGGQKHAPDGLAKELALFTSTSSISSIGSIHSFANRGLGGKTDICDLGTAMAYQITKAV